MRTPLYIASIIVVFSTFFLFSCGTPYSKWSGLQSAHYPKEGKGPTLARQLGFSREAVVVIVHADDIGIHRDQTDGALDAMKMGMVKTGSVMVPCPDFERVASIWRENPDLDLGLHLTLTSGHRENYRWKPVLPKSKVPSLYDPEGYMWLTPEDLRKHLNIEEALLEIEAQITTALQAGLKPTHIDTHQGTYNLHPDLARGVMKLSKKYNLPMIPSVSHMEEMRKKGYVFPNTYWMYVVIAGEQYRPAYRKKIYDRWLQNLKPGVHQMIVHPSFVSEEYAQYVWRPFMLTGDYAYWTSPETKALADKRGIVFIGYRKLQKLQAKHWNLSVDGVMWE
jgi:predicted glycoside hydrolase/deacetylase ChbG (UPF0249 family)